MIVSILLLVLVVLAATQVRGRRTPSDGVGVAVRRFFQYVLLAAMVAIVAIGIAGLLGRGLDRGALVVADTVDLARDLAFLVVGIPTLVGVAALTRSRLRVGPRERQSLGWMLYLASVELVALVVAMAAMQDVLLWIMQARRFDGGALSRAIVWGAVLAVHVRIGVRIPPRSRDARVAATIIGLWGSASGIAALVAAAYDSVLSVPLVVEGTSAVPSALASIIVGGAVWIGYWFGALRDAPRTAGRQFYLVVVGVAGGLLASIIGATIIVYHVLVWWFGVPWALDAAAHFRSASGAVGALVAGLVVWSFHRTVVVRERGPARDAAHRIADYVTAGIALGAIGVAVAVLAVAGIESATASVALAGQPARNTLLLACTLLLVGGPVWARWWQAIRRAVAADPEGERSSVPRRVYLVVLFGVVGIAAVAALIVAVAFCFDDLVVGRFGLNTLRRARWPIGVLVSAGVIAFAHWRIYRADRVHAVEPTLRHLLLVGPVSEEVERELGRRLGARIEVWGTEGDVWEVDAIVTALTGLANDTVAVVPSEDGPRALSVERH